MINIYSFEGGKYRVERDTNTLSVKIYRNCEHWPVMEEEVKYSKFFHAMLNYIDDLTTRVNDGNDYEPTLRFFRD